MSRRRGGANSSSQQRIGEQQRRGRNARTPGVRTTTPRRHQQQQAPAQAARRQQQHQAEADAAQNEDAPDRFDQAAQQLPEDLRQFARTLRTTVVEESGRVSWTDIQGLHSAKNSLIFAAHLPLVRPEFFVGARRRTKGILLFGPPGTGKTLLAQALLNDRPEMTFFNVKSATLTAPLLGESEKIVKALGITTDHNSVILVAATSFPWDLDNALLRRLDRRIYVPLPDASAREEMLRHNMRGNLVENIDWPNVARRLQNYSGADMAALCAAAASGQFWEEVTAGTDLTNPQVLAAVADRVMGWPITMANLERAIGKMRFKISAAEHGRRLRKIRRIDGTERFYRLIMF